ncbi:MAG TPA: Spy/CpxP family protein refolding chaperone [Longimicrobium sp.]|nr:Spy/CpxP family protein refolding chaperone [Longimicrobium sp.]
MDTMKIRMAVPAVALLLAACGGGQAPAPRAGGNPRPLTARDSAERRLMEAYRGAQMPSVYALIGARERLKLTSAQVTALDSIAEAAREMNRPIADSLRSLTNSGNGGPIRQPRGEFQTARSVPLLQRIGQNNRRAMEAIQAQLTPEQRTAVCTLAREQRDDRYGDRRRRGGIGGGGGGRGDGGRGGMRGGMPGMYGDSIRGPGGRFGGGAGGWPWCTGPARVPVDSARVTAPQP